MNRTQLKCKFFKFSPLVARLEKLNPDYAHSYVLYNTDNRAVGNVFNSENVTPWLNLFENAPDLLNTIEGMMHDIHIFYGKYREPDNQHYTALKNVLAKIRGEK